MPDTVKISFPNKLLDIFFISPIFAHLFTDHPYNAFFLGLNFLLISCFVYITTASVVGGLISFFYGSKDSWEAGDRFVVFSLLSANILFVNLLTIISIFSYERSVANGGENDPIWVLGLFIFVLFGSLFLGFVGGLLLIPPTIKKFHSSIDKIYFTKGLMKKWSIRTILVVLCITIISLIITAT